MSSVVVNTVPSADILEKEPVEINTVQPVEAVSEQKLMRLANAVLPALSGEAVLPVVFGGLGSCEHSFWLTEAVAAVLGALLDESVHVLAVGASPAADAPRTFTSGLTCLPSIEYAFSGLSTVNAPQAGIERRLQELTEQRRKVLLHVANLPVWLSNPSLVGRISGVVLLTRAAHTRKAAISSFVNKLSQYRTPLIGAVLLDREFPIPERLYRLL